MVWITDVVLMGHSVLHCYQSHFNHFLWVLSTDLLLRGCETTISGNLSVDTGVFKWWLRRFSNFLDPTNEKSAKNGPMTVWVWRINLKTWLIDFIQYIALVVTVNSFISSVEHWSEIFILANYIQVFYLGFWIHQICDVVDTKYFFFQLIKSS